MREIKFRTAHYNYDGTFYQFSFWGPLVDETGCYGFKGPSSVSGTTNSHQEQYTGLKDKNGVEIYEGDVYKRYNYLYKVIWSDFEDGFRGICIARKSEKNNDWELLDKSSDKHYYINSDVHNLSEVIGNIHQNPELIK